MQFHNVVEVSSRIRSAIVFVIHSLVLNMYSHTQLAEHGSQLAEHGSQLAEHGSQLAEHGSQLAEKLWQFPFHPTYGLAIWSTIKAE